MWAISVFMKKDKYFPHLASYLALQKISRGWALAFAWFLDGFAQLESVEHVDESEMIKIWFGVTFTRLRLQIILTRKNWITFQLIRHMWDFPTLSYAIYSLLTLCALSSRLVISIQLDSKIIEGADVQASFLLLEQRWILWRQPIWLTTSAPSPSMIFR